MCVGSMNLLENPSAGGIALEARDAGVGAGGDEEGRGG